MKKVRLFFLLLGLCLLIVVIKQVGLDLILLQLRQFAWFFLLSILAYGLVYWIDSWAWKFAFRKSLNKHQSIASLASIRIAGDAVTNTAPFGQLGGEPVKAYLLKQKGITLDFAIASQVVDKTTLVISQIMYVLLGLVILALGWDIARPFQLILLFLFVCGSILVILFLYFQQKGIFSFIARFLMRFALTRRYIEPKLVKIQHLDQHVALYYKEQKKDFFLALSLYFCGWLVGVFEVYIILVGLDIKGGLAFAIVIDSIHQLVRSFSFMIPYGLGAQEGANVLVFSGFGLNAAFGVSLTLIRRIRELAWAIVGYVLIALYHVPLKKELISE
ncbi:MAG: lysylphosphatidylglycerol synthase transmembrane domain-containing protein [Chlamydiota bacterium]|nr:lysylphosphatidylglycerol synthase transmembrane domain-containing protein [Chlamydiota bacterium]